MINRDQINNANSVFVYPSAPTDRKHAPKGYLNYQSFKPWLRDEFGFRCVYCLTREVWTPNGADDFGVDHLIPQSSGVIGIDEYGNLVYACCSCNRNRQDTILSLHPCDEAYGIHLEVNSDGYIESSTFEGRELIDQCNLNRLSLVKFRHGMIRLINHLVSQKTQSDAEILNHLLSLPKELPNLALLRPPAGNDKPEGIKKSYFANEYD